MTKTKKLPHFRLYPSDFLGDTGRLNAVRFGAYTRLLFTSWIAPLHDDIDELIEIARADEQTIKYVLSMYFDLVDGIWLNRRLERERVKAIILYNARVDAGRKGGNAKAKLDQSYPVADGGAVATHNSEPITHNSIAYNTETILSETILSETQKEHFVSFYTLFPNKQAKTKAELAFARVNPSNDLLSTMIIGLQKQIDAGEFEERGSKERLFPESWLSQKRWEDEVKEAFKFDKDALV